MATASSTSAGGDEAGRARMTFDSLASAATCFRLRCSPCGRRDRRRPGHRRRRPFQPTGLPDVTVMGLGTTCDDVAARAGLRLMVTDDKLAVHGDVADEVLARPDAMTTGQALACARRISRFRLPRIAGRLGAGISIRHLVGVDGHHRRRPGRSLGAMAYSGRRSDAAGADRCLRTRGARRARHQGSGRERHGAARTVHRRNGFRQVRVPAHAHARA